MMHRPSPEQCQADDERQAQDEPVTIGKVHDLELPPAPASPAS
jgi:hypothetical protein